MKADDIPLIELAGVDHWFADGGRRRAVLTAVDLTIGAGEVVVVLGRSGSGKTTLLNLLSVLEVPQRGAVRIRDGDRRVVTADLHERARTLLRRRLFGFVFQQNNLIPTLTVLENAALCARLCGYRDAEQRARRGLAAVGLEQRADAWPEQLSGGEQQRVAVVRAIAHTPQVVVADEPTGSLDADSAGEVMELLLGQVRTQGAALVLATHHRDFATRADQVLELGGAGP